MERGKGNGGSGKVNSRIFAFSSLRWKEREEIVVKAPIPNHDSMGNLQGTRILIRLGLNFDQVIINSVMACVLVLSFKVRRVEWSK
jgi:hypothetical protein